MQFLFFFLLLSLPVLEIASFVWMSRWVGLVPMLLLLAASAALGIVILKSQTLFLGRSLIRGMRAGTPPDQTLLSSGLISLAAVLLIVPGFASDVVALIFLFPPTRLLLMRALSLTARKRFERFRSQYPRSPRPTDQPRQETVIDVDFSEVPKSPKDNDTKDRDSPWAKKK